MTGFIRGVILGRSDPAAIPGERRVLKISDINSVPEPPRSAVFKKPDLIMIYPEINRSIIALIFSILGVCFFAPAYTAYLPYVFAGSLLYLVIVFLNKVLVHKRLCETGCAAGGQVIETASLRAHRSTASPGYKAIYEFTDKSGASRRGTIYTGDISVYKKQNILVFYDPGDVRRNIVYEYSLFRLK